MAFVRPRGLTIALTASGVPALAVALGVYVAFLRDLPDLRSVADYRPPLVSTVLDRQGRPIGEFFVERRQLTPMESIPGHVVDAFVAGEDSAFFEHAGIDYMSILRAAWVNLRAGGEIKQGGSTITQQMVKGLLLSPERRFRRKVREMILARRIEQRFSKQEILYLYLNQIYFGHGAYGIGQAAHTYFGRDVAELSTSEGALLAGLPKAPSRYSPFSDPEQAEARRRYVLERMLEEEYLDAESHAAALADVPLLAEREDFDAAAYFTEEVRRYLFERLGGERVLRSGLVIETTLDIDLQRAAVAALQRGLRDLDRRQGYRGPVRRVARSEIPAEISRLEVENGLAPAEPETSDLEDEEGQPAPEGEGTFAAELAEADDAATELASALEGDETPGPEMPERWPLLGVVSEVDPDQQIARVSFSPVLEAIVRLEDVAWARPANPSRAPHTVQSVERVLREGDVAPFTPVPGPEAQSEDGGEPPADEEILYVALDQEPIVQGALLSIDLASQEVLALVGGYDFEQSQFNRVTQAQRQPGSAFKPLIYGAAIAQGYTAASIVWDRPAVYSDETSGFTWRPRNYKGSFYGPITLREALTRSVNNATVHLFRDVGVDFVIEYARGLGIESPLNRDLSLALGSSGVSLLELTRAYATFPAAGRQVDPVFIRRVTDRDGEILLEGVVLGSAAQDEPASPEPSPAVAAPPDPADNGFDADPLIPEEQAYLITDLLRAVVTDSHGTGWRLRALGRPVAGKTGTTNDQGDAWFMGFSPEIATGVWVGHDESRFLGWGETGSRAAAPVWVDYMGVALRERPVTDFPVPEPIVFARIDRKTGLLADASSTNTVFQAFLAGTEPKESARAARTTSEGRRLLRLDSF